MPGGRLVRGFTLIEIMVVIVILGILAAIVVPKVLDAPDKARSVKIKQDIRSIESALNFYKLDNFNYPTSDQGLQALVNLGLRMDIFLFNPYVYLSPGTHNDQGVDIYTLGADNQPGGEGPNADVGNWDLK